MSNNKEKHGQNGDLNALQDELEKRYGADVAQGIVDSIRKAQVNEAAPDFMVVKAANEVMELFRGEAQALLRQLKCCPRTWGNAASNITFLDKRRLEVDFEHVWRLYWVSMKTYYPLYKRAMAEYQGKITGFRRPSDTTGMAGAAKAIAA